MIASPNTIETAVPNEPSRQTGNSPMRRLRQLERVLTLIELLAPLRYGATLRELTYDIKETLGPYCERTIRRDLETLALLGLVWRDRRQDGSRVWTWHRQDRSEPLRRIADVQAELREEYV